MKIYLVRNFEILQNAYIDYNDREEVIKEKEILSITGEEHAKKLLLLPILKKIDAIYSSNFVSALATSKYIAKENNIKINVSSDLKDRRLGAIDDVDMVEFNYKTYHNFDYKLRLGESINDVKKRSSLVLKRILSNNYNKVVIVTHEVNIISLLLNFCELGYNYDNDIILSYKDNVICEHNINTNELYELVFDKNNIKSINKIIF